MDHKTSNPAPLGFLHDTDLHWKIAGDGVRRKIIAWDDLLMVVRVEFQQGAIGPLHEHHHTQISLIESGSFEVEISGVKQVLHAGDAYYVPPHALHGCVCLEAGVLIDSFSPAREDFIA